MDEKKMDILKEVLHGKRSHTDALFVKWLEESEEYQQLYEEALVHAARDLSLKESFDKDGVWKRVLKDTGKYDRVRLLRRKFMRYVAIFCCIIGGTAFFLWNSGQSDKMELTGTDISIVPGGCRAMLVLDDGRNVELSDASTLKVTDQSTVVTVRDKDVVYSTEDTLNDNAMNRVITPRGGEYSLELADGTKVWLNAATELSYPVKFKQDIREVELIGEAYFEVAKNADKPFIVYSGGMKIKVLGTSFNVKAYVDEERQTTLVEGCVEVAYANQQVKINPGEQVVLKEELLVVREVDTRISTGWKDGLFVFDDQQLVHVLQELGRWYNVDISIADEEIKQLKFTSNFPRYENINRVLNIIEIAACVKCELKGRLIIVRTDN